MQQTSVAKITFRTKTYLRGGIFHTL